MYEVPKQTYRLCDPVEVPYALFVFVFVFFVLEVFKCFETCLEKC
jgi:hypothetical protein